MNTADARTDLSNLLIQAPGNPPIWNQFLFELNKRLKTDSAVLFVTSHTASTEIQILYSIHIPSNKFAKMEEALIRHDSFGQFINQKHHKVYFNHPLNYQLQDDFEFSLPLFQQEKFHVGVSIPCNHYFSICLILSRDKPFLHNERSSITEVLNQILPCLSQALHDEQHLKIKNQLFHLINTPFDAFIIVDQSLKILFVDPVYQTIINQIGCIEFNKGYLTILNKSFKNELLSTLPALETIQSIHSSCFFCQILAIPIRLLDNLYHWECFNHGYILVFTHDKNQNHNIERLRKIYHLSHCEAICAIHFINTPSINNIAEKISRSNETVRNHIKHIMQKMDVHTQAELMKKLIGLISL